MRHHQELDCHQGQKQHKADHVIAAHDELAKGFNDFPGGRRTFLAVQQDAVFRRRCLSAQCPPDAAGSRVEFRWQRRPLERVAITNLL
jgi:hypothetical protein